MMKKLLITVKKGDTVTISYVPLSPVGKVQRGTQFTHNHTDDKPYILILQEVSQ